ncbi:MAG: sodium:solute symporter [Clostridia bacterium]|nr:sodium:solute symporter [Clostridia bacterium]
MPQENWVYIAFLVAYVASMVVIAYICRKRSTSLNSFYLAGRGIGPWMSAFAYGTTYFSSVILIGYAGKLGALFGLGVLWIGIGNAIIGTYLPWKILAKRTKVMTSAMKAKTMPEFFECRYKNSKVKLVTAIIIGIFLVPYTASVYQGIGHLFAAVFGMDAVAQETAFIICVLALAAITALYVFFGGYFATALSDFVQGIIVLVGIIVMVVLVYTHVGGFSEAFARLDSASKGFIPTGANAFDLLCLVILTSLGTWGLPQIIHKFYAIKDKSSVKRGTIVSVIFCGVVGICAYGAGATGMLFGDQIGFSDKVASGNFDSIMPAIFTTALPPVVIGLMIIMVLSASMSTLASLGLSCSSAIMIDVYAGYVNKNIDDKKLNTATRFASVFFIALSAVIAIFKPAGIVELMGFSWGTLAGCFIGPYLYGLFMKKSNIYGTWASIIATLVITATLIFVPGFGMAKSPLIGVICMFTSLIITPIVSALTAKRATKNNLDYDYSLLDENEVK